MADDLRADAIDKLNADLPPDDPRVNMELFYRVQEAQKRQHAIDYANFDGSIAMAKNIKANMSRVRAQTIRDWQAEQESQKVDNSGSLTNTLEIPPPGFGRM